MPIDSDYNEVKDRIIEFRTKHPEGCFRPVDPKRPFWIEEVAGKVFVVYAAAAYRSADDKLPGIGLAWEPFPGPTNFTRDSELQNAETSAWGRAIVAALAADTRKGIATAEDVRNRSATDPLSQTQRADAKGPPRGPDEEPTTKGNARRGPRVLDGWADIAEQRAAHEAFEADAGAQPDGVREAIKDWRKAGGYGYPMSRTELEATTSELHRLVNVHFGHCPSCGEPITEANPAEPEHNGCAACAPM